MRSTRHSLDSDREISARLKSTAVRYSIILVIGLAYLVFVLLTGIRIPCPIYGLTGLKCPGCGVTRLVVSVARLDFASAFRFNPFLFITGPLILAYVALSEVSYIVRGKRRLGRLEAFVWVELILALLYGVLRNIFPI